MSDSLSLHLTKYEEDAIKIIRQDIVAIGQAIDSDNEAKIKNVHIQMDGRYTTYIPNFGKSMYGYRSDDGFAYEYLDKKSLLHNLSIMKGRLEGYVDIFPIIKDSKLKQGINLSVTNTNEIGINVSFKDVSQQIEKMPGLPEKETNEIKDRISELEKINNEKMSKKKKWEKIKPIISFVLDKGADVAVPILRLVIQMKLGL
ncbi:hypothetical protein ACOBMG_10125 (plasmid) [Limosilactobacillus mucosae]|uniref:hypothetical protein n=1 Tax=Limosilactobacillus mucosae TaxID=97478 RepID=UPI0035212519